MLSLYWDTSDIDVVDHFSMNQCRSEEITLKEDFGNGFLSLADIGKNLLPHLSSCFRLFLLSKPTNVQHHRPWALKPDVCADAAIQYQHLFLSCCFFLMAAEESPLHQSALLDMNFHSLGQHGDTFGDEDQVFDLLGRYCKLVQFYHVCVIFELLTFVDRGF